MMLLLILLYFSYFILTKPVIFYVSPEASSCDLSLPYICKTEKSPCPLFCPFNLQEFRSSKNVTIKMKSGTYDLSKTTPSLINIQNGTFGSLILEIRLFNISTEYQYILLEPLHLDSSVTINRIPESEYEYLLEHYTLYTSNFYFFYILSNSVTIELRNVNIQSPYPKAPKILYAGCLHRTFIKFCATSSCQKEPKIVLKNVTFHNFTLIASHVSHFISYDSNFDSVGGLVLMSNQIRSGSDSYSIDFQNSVYTERLVADPCALTLLKRFEIAVQSAEVNVKILNSHFYSATYFGTGDDTLFSTSVWNGNLNFEAQKTIFSGTQKVFSFFFFSSSSDSEKDCCFIKMSEISVIGSKSSFLSADFFKSHANVTDAQTHHSYPLCTSMEISNSTFKNNMKNFISSTAPSYFRFDMRIIDVHQQILLQDFPILRIFNTTMENGEWTDNSFFDLTFSRIEYYYEDDDFSLFSMKNKNKNSTMIAWSCDNFDGEMAFLEVVDSKFLSLKGSSVFKISSDSSYVKFVNSEFLDGSNSAMEVTGAVGVIVESCKFERYKTSAVHLELKGETPLLLESCYYFADCVFRENEGVNGGAVYVSFAPPNMAFYDPNGFSNCIFEKNSVSKNGGAVYALMTNDLQKEVYRMLSFQNSSFLGNNAKFGGALFLDEITICIMADHHQNTVYFVDNYASGSGGAIFTTRKGSYFYDSWGCNFFNFSGIQYYPTFWNNYLVDLKGNEYVNNVLGRADRLFVDKSIENSCREFVGQNNFWKCSTDGARVVDYRNTPFYSPTYEDVLLRVEVEGREGQEYNVIMRNRDVTHPGDSTPFYFFAEYGDFKDNKVNVRVRLGETGDFQVVVFSLIRRNEGFISETWFYVTIVSCFLVICLSVFCCLLFLCCCIMTFVSAFCVTGYLSCLSRKQKSILIAEQDFENFDLEDSSPELRLGGWSLPDKSEEDDEELNEDSFLFSSIKVRKRRIGSHHVFYGDLNGFGTIFFKSSSSGLGRKRLHPVFSGTFKDRKKEGEGTEFYFDNSKFLTSVPPLWYSSLVTFIIPPKFKMVKKFDGTFSENERNGFGTEYSKDQNFVMGRWANGALTKIFSIDHPLEIFDLRSDVEILDRIGDGGFSFVFRAVYKKKETKKKEKMKKEKIVALKVFEEIRRKKREASVNYGGMEKENYIHDNYEMGVKIGTILKRISMINHPNIISIIGWTGPKFVKSQFSYAMELCECSVLEYYQKCMRKKGRMSLEMKDKILFESALGMECFHDQCGFIHRDLKLSNLLIDRTDPIVSMNIKICDFNLGLEDFKRKVQFSLTIAGSPFNCAPEGYAGQYDIKCDVYSFSIMMYELYFDQVGDPFRVGKRNPKCPECGEMMTENLVHEMSLHHKKHGARFRPRIFEEEVEGEVDVVEGRFDTNDFRVELMERAWHDDPSERPSFREIVSIYKQNT